MKRIMVLLMMIITLVCCGKKQKEEPKNETAIKSNDLPVMQITFLDGRIVDAKKLEVPAVLILFQPDCEHCQDEANQIREHLTEFKNYTLYFVSAAPVPDIQRFSTDFKLSDKEKVFFGSTTISNILDNFGPIQAPSIYIYSAAGQRIQEFNGEVAIEVILKYL